MTRAGAPVVLESTPPGAGRARWARVFVGHSLLSAAQQAVGAATGIVVVRELAKSDYAYYVLAIGMSAAIAVLADAGVVSTLMRLGGSQRQQPDRLAVVVAHAVRFRRLATAAASVAVMPFLVVLLLRAGTDAVTLALVGLLVLSGNFTGAASQMSAVLVRIDYQFVRAARVGLFAAVVRVILTCLTVVLPSQVALLALLLLNTLVPALEVRLYRRLIHLPSHGDSGLDEVTRETFRSNAKRTLPKSAFYLIQGQLVVWLLALSGEVSSLAEISALARFGLLFTLISSIVSSFVAPVVGRQNRGPTVAAVSGAALVAYTAASAAVLGSMLVVPHLYLSVLGDGYRGLDAQFLLVSLGSFVAGLTGVLSGVTSGRAWLKWAWIYIPLTLVWLGTLSVLIGVATLERAALFGTLSTLSGLVSESVMLLSGFRRDFITKRPVRAQATDPGA